MEISLALSGGCCKRSVSSWSLDKFDELGVNVRAISGASVGSFCGYDLLY